MSKAFTKEADSGSAALESDLPPIPPLLPPGARNYMTLEGQRRLQEELRQLVEVERPPLLSRKSEGDPEATAQLRRVDIRIRDFTQRLAQAEIVHPPADPREIQFGAIVTVRDSSGEELEYRIVGVNELDLEECWISSASPLARVLVGHRAGETVTFRAPAGPRRLEIVSVSYPPSVG